MESRRVEYHDFSLAISRECSPVIPLLRCPVAEPGPSRPGKGDLPGVRCNYEDWCFLPPDRWSDQFLNKPNGWRIRPGINYKHKGRKRRASRQKCRGRRRIPAGNFATWGSERFLSGKTFLKIYSRKCSGQFR